MNPLRCLLAGFSTTLLIAQAASPIPASQGERFRAEAFRTHGAYEDLAWLCDRIGHRLSGSPQLDQAIAWAQARMKASGFVNVHAEPVMVPHWVRGRESAELLLPAPHRLKMEAKTLPDVPSANVVGEIRGTEKPEEIILLSGHLDSWDVGQGAQDDGAGCVLVMEAARLIQSLGLKPRRTIRVVLFTNEENGLRGGLAYRDAHRGEFKNIIAALEPFGPLEFRLGGSGADVGPMAAEGVPGIGVGHAATHYFDIHHTHADT